MKKLEDKIDRRKIPTLFRAVERDSRPVTFYGKLISDDGFNFVCFAARDDDTSHVKERVLRKRSFSFSEIEIEEFQLFARAALLRMQRETADLRMQLEASESIESFATAKLVDLGV